MTGRKRCSPIRPFDGVPPPHSLSLETGSRTIGAPLRRLGRLRDPPGAGAAQGARSRQRIRRASSRPPRAAAGSIVAARRRVARDSFHQAVRSASGPQIEITLRCNSAMPPRRPFCGTKPRQSGRRPSVTLLRLHGVTQAAKPTPAFSTACRHSWLRSDCLRR